MVCAHMLGSTLIDQSVARRLAPVTWYPGPAESIAL
jgi:hypothetical protein